VLVVSFNAPHLPVRVPPPELIPSWEGRQPRTRQQRFDAAIEALDTELGRLLDGMPATVRRRTMTMFLGDNGTPPEMVRPPWDPEHAKLTVYETGVNVPLILSGAGVGPRGGHTDALVHLVDVLPTLSKLLLGRDATQGDGVSFAGLLERPGSGRRDVVATQVFGPNGQGDRDFHQRMIRDARWKLVQPAPGVDELYDLSADPRELRPMDLTEPRAQQTRDRLAHALDLSLP
jgi:arylsulfatase A-like enzyme